MSAFRITSYTDLYNIVLCSRLLRKHFIGKDSEMTKTKKFINMFSATYFCPSEGCMQKLVSM